MNPVPTFNDFRTALNAAPEHVRRMLLVQVRRFAAGEVTASEAIVAWRSDMDATEQAGEVTR